MKPVVIVPYRNREEHLKQFAPKMKEYLECDILVVEQLDNKPFNRGALLNIGFLETENDYPYFIMHDVDMIPITADYSYPDKPTHIATQCSQFEYKMPYGGYFGGVNLFTKEQFRSVNGFVNTLRGWGAEDDILRMSFEKKGIEIQRRECRFESLDHERNINWNDHRYNVSVMNKGRNFKDGLSSLRYKKYDVIETDLYKLIKVVING